jgi:hypothetical protein
MRDEPRPRHDPSLGEDARNLTIVAGSAALTALLTIGLLSAAPTRSVEVRTIERVQPGSHRVLVSYQTGANRLYGTVLTHDGASVTGYIRWDRNEGSWSDVLDASKPRPRGSASASCIRFGHVQRIDVRSGDEAELTLKSGEHVVLDGRATDLGSGLRALVVEMPGGSVAELGWKDLERVEFAEAPADAPPSSRLFGTLETRSGLEFTGYVAWDVDEIYTSDVLDGDDETGERQRIPFGAIATIERESPRSARVTLHDGSTLGLHGTNDVDRSNGGISVSDPALGQVEVDWDGFDRVRFHDEGEEAAFTAFDGGAPLRGTLVTRDGEELVGEIVWDDDESFTWEMLNGEADGVTFDIELGQISSIRRVSDGARVTLRDGRSFTLSGSNDVDGDNRGIVVRNGSGAHEIDWEDFAELRLGS